MDAKQKQEFEQLVEQTIRTLYEKGIAAIDLAPLVKLHEAVKTLDFRQPADGTLQPGGAYPPGDSMHPGKAAVAPDVPAAGAGGAYPAQDRMHAPGAAMAPQVPHAPSTSAGGAWNRNSEQGGVYDREGRRGEMKASEDLLARASAIVDLLVQSGDSPEHACQAITRQLLSVGIQLPESGGDARAWKRLMNWRNSLIHHKRSGPAWDAYCAFKEQLAHIPPEKRIQMAVGERLWDQRQVEFSAQNIA